MVDDLLQLSVLIADIYNAALMPSAWTDVLAKVTTFVGGTSINLYSRLPASPRPVVSCGWGNDPHYQRLYLETYSELDPLSPGTRVRDAGVVYSQSDLIPHEEFEETRFYKEWAAPQGFADAVGVNLDTAAARTATVAIRRNAAQGRVDAECRRKLGLLVPHLQRAVLIGNVIDDGKMTAAALNSTVMALADAVFLVDPRARILFANAAAAALLRDGKIVCNLRTGLSAVQANANRLLRAAIASSEGQAGGAAAKALALPISTPGRTCALAHVLPLTARTCEEAALPKAVTAAVVIRGASPGHSTALETVGRIYRLTAKEMRVLQAIVEVGGAPRVAEVLGISETTVKTHLRALFQKTECRRQADLVKLVAGAASPFLTIAPSSRPNG